MNRIELDEETRDLLDRVRHKRKCLTLYDMPEDLAEAAVFEIGKILLDPLKLPTVQYNTYRWYLRELSKLLRVNPLPAANEGRWGRGRATRCGPFHAKTIPC
jgi:hypothetical protein